MKRSWSFIVGTIAGSLAIFAILSLLDGCTSPANPDPLPEPPALATTPPPPTPPVIAATIARDYAAVAATERAKVYRETTDATWVRRLTAADTTAQAAVVRASQTPTPANRQAAQTAVGELRAVLAE